jgi:ubiquinone/menaquinone biosynthesis C-methylase UbiE
VIRRIAAAGAAVVVGAAFWWRKNPSACPYSQRFWVEAPHPFITRERLREILDPQPGERLLEVGPGTGYYALPVASWLAPGGTLEVLDVQREMLDHTLTRAAEQRVEGIVATEADAQSMPFSDASMDGAYLVTVLGEIPDQEAALRALHRVVRPGGRVVVGELFGDPHWVSPGALQRRAEAAGFRWDRRAGTPLGYFARLARD